MSLLGLDVDRFGGDDVRQRILQSEHLAVVVLPDVDFENISCRFKETSPSRSREYTIVSNQTKQNKCALSNGKKHTQPGAIFHQQFIFWAPGR